MAAKAAKGAMPGGHTAGIYADMTVDGPEIGTLVVIVDRAKNLPNRKTMGKQDPYCAARLGKEAKKTETDRRGGQTPRWDQELRFTVHDSPDYHQLKVSVFNDDKRTDLIGETWVPLDKVVLPGGGTSDIWHNLNCKGRYAGEIRIELTYYDTRPKEGRTPEPAAAPYPIEPQERVFDKVTGPRQPKPVKRRPLPADPTSADPSPLRPLMPDHVQSSPLPYTPPRSHQNPHNTTTAPHSIVGSTAQNGSTAPPLSQPIYEAANASQYRHQYSSGPHEEPLYNNQLPEQVHPAQDNPYLPSYHQQHDFERHSAPEGVNGYAELQAPYSSSTQDGQSHFSQDHYTHGQSEKELPELPSYNPRLVRPDSQAVQNQHMHAASHSIPIPPLPHQRSVGDMHQQSHPQADATRYSDVPSVGRERYQESPLHHRSVGNRHSIQYSPYYPTIEDEGPPPPPPVHRSNGVNLANNHVEHSHTTQRNQYPPLPAPAPLNIRQGRGSLSNVSPLSQSYTDLTRDDYNLSMPSREDQVSPASAAPIPVYDNYGRPELQQSRDGQVSPASVAPIPVYDNYNRPERQQSRDSQYGAASDMYIQPTPPSLVAGYDPIVAEAESQRIWEEKQAMSSRSLGSTPQNERKSMHNPRRDSHMILYNNVNPSVQNLQKENFHGRGHRNSAPVIKPRALSPDPRTPQRKSVSPSPQPASREGSFAGVPFSPDSYEALNPNLKSASSINSTGPKYKTPEQARDAFREKEREAKLEEGPIIGIDGKVIDPSDHLPTDTWAPEPERKTPRKGPEIHLRFNSAPRGAQPMSNSGPRLPRETVIRPHSIATTVHSYSADNISPTAAVRNRLQKKTRAGPSHANSSPILPVSNGTPPSYPLREHVNYGMGGSSPGYPQDSPSAPPPVPAKVPLAAGTRQEDWGMGGISALSEEMKRIDIGLGPGSGGRNRRSRYGP
ncbi:hypothetical protein MMC30_004836 [Trapelia coarctata]|nr:hypothetical protein [Trapelia coarctata]